MAQYTINTSNIAPQNVQTAFNQTNLNFNQIFAAGPVTSNIQIANNTISTTNTNGNLVLNPNGIGAVVANASIMPDIANVRMIGSGIKPFNTVYTQYIDAVDATFSGNTYVAGNLLVTGSIVNVSYSNLSIANLNITLANGSSNSATANGAGLLIDGANTGFTYQHSLNSWYTNIGIYANAFTGDGSGLTNVTANVNANTLLGNTLSSSVVNSNLTSFGLIGNISATGTISINTVFADQVQSNSIISNYLFGDGSNITNINANVIVGNIPFANSALTANLAALATQAINADSALYALNANTANSATTATSAITANSAHYAVQADMANSAVVAGLAEELSSAANVSIHGNITTGGDFIGNGAVIQGNIVSSNNFIGNGAVINGNVLATNVSASGNITGGYFYGDISNTTGGYSNANVSSYLPTYEGDIGVLAFNSQAAIIGPNDGNGSAYLQLLQNNVRFGNDGGDISINARFAEYNFGATGNLILPYLPGSATAITLNTGGTGYTTATNVPTNVLSGSGYGMTVDIVADTGNSNPVTSVTINQPGVNYSVGSNVQIAQYSSTGTASFTVNTVGLKTPSINYANGQPYGGGGLYANTVGSFGSDMGIGPNYGLNDPAILFSEDDLLIRTGGTANTGYQNNGQIDIAASEQLYIGLSNNLADATYVSSYQSLIHFENGGTNINVVINGNTSTFDSSGNFTVPGNLGANAITLKNTDDFAQIVFSNDGGGTNNGQIKVDGGTNMVISANNNFYVKRTGSDRLAITDTNTDLMASTNVRIQSNKAGSANIWNFDSTGNLTLPSNTFAINYANGTQVSLDGNYSNSNVSSFLADFSDNNISTTGNIVANTFLTNGNLYIGDLGVGPGSAIVQEETTLIVYAQGANASTSIGWAESILSPGPVARIDFNTEGNSTGNVTINTGNSSGPQSWTFDNTGNLTVPGNIIGNNSSPAPSITGFDSVNAITVSASGNVNGDIFVLNFAGNTTYSTLQKNQNPPYGGEQYGIELLTTTDDANVFSSVSSGPDYVALLSTNAGNANVILQGGYGVTISTSNATGGDIQTWTFLQDGVSLFPNDISTTGNVTAGNFVGSGSGLTGVAKQTTGFWSVTAGTNTYSFTVPAGTWQMWVTGNIPNGIIVWNATATVTNTNVPVVGQQYAWVYNGGGTPIDFVSIPNQFVGTGNAIVRSNIAPSATTNRFDFSINNTSGNTQTVQYGYTAL